MYIEFKKLTFANIRSFGGKKTEINFTQGLNLITGPNGSGKSSILSALSYCLYGKPFSDDIKIARLINWRNKKGLITECEFIVDNKVHYKIIRGMQPDIIKIYRDNQELDLLSSKKLTQEEIDKIIGINYTLFKQVISLSVNNNKPFIKLPAAEKREVAEQIFGISLFGQMLKLLKRKMADIRIQFEMNKKELMIVNENEKSLERKYTQIKEAQNNFETNKQQEIKTIVKKMEDQNKVKENIATILHQKEADLKKANEQGDITTQLQQYKTMRDESIRCISTMEYNINSLRNKIKRMEKTTLCPECNTELTEEHKNNEINKRKLEITNNQQKLDGCTKNKKLAEENISRFENIVFSKNQYSFEIEQHYDKLALIEKDLEYLNTSLINAQNKKFEVDVESIRKELIESHDKCTKLTSENNNFIETIKTNDIITSILSETGIKSYFFKKIIPILNQKINSYLNLFEIPIIVNFDECMNEIISNMGTLSTETSYGEYSEGEKRRIDMSIILAFIEVTKIVSNWNCNTLLIDELLDSSMDEDGLDKFVLSLKNMASEIKGQCVYVISHRLQQNYYDSFNQKINVSRNVNGFSTLTFS